MPANHASDARIVAERLTYATADGRTLFHDTTLAFGRDRTGLIGPNGSGKTTLIRLLAGELTPASGVVRRSGPVAVLPQAFRPGADQPLSAILRIDDRLAALRRLERGSASVLDVELVGDDWDLPDRAAAVLARFGLAHLALDRAAGTLSGGEATRVGLAALALGRPDFLLLDEPTNHLDRDSRAALYAFVEEWTGGLLCVSHDRELLRRMDRIIELRADGPAVYGGNYDAHRARRDTDDAAAERELDSARAALRLAEREARAVRERQARRDARGRRSRATANMPKILLNGRRARAEGTTARVRAITEREVAERRDRLAAARTRVEERERPRFELPSTKLPAGRTVVEANDVSVRFADLPRPVLDRVSLRIVGPERVAITGPNGSGKTTLLRVLTGRTPPDSGVVRCLPAAEIACLDQDAAALDPSRSVLDNFRAVHPRLPAMAIHHTLARFLFSSDEARRSAGTLSGGQRMRAALACALGGERPPSLLVLDEPTNHLDLDALESLEAALRAWDGALVVVSHDETFLDAINIDRWIGLT